MCPATLFGSGSISIAGQSRLFHLEFEVVEEKIW